MRPPASHLWLEHGQCSHIPLGQSEPWELTLPQTSAGLSRATCLTPIPGLGEVGMALGGPVPAEGLALRLLCFPLPGPVPLLSVSSASSCVSGRCAGWALATVNTGLGAERAAGPFELNVFLCNFAWPSTE